MIAECVHEIRRGGGPKGECPVWDVRAQVLYWIDIDGCTVHRFDPASGANVSREVGEQVGAVALCHDPSQLLLATRRGLIVLSLADNSRNLICGVESDLPANRLNDGRCDARGRFWVGSMRDPSAPSDRFGTLYRYDSESGLRTVLSGLGTPNGLAFSPDGKRMYLSDSNTQVRSIWAFDYDIDDGVCGNRTLFATTENRQGRPDGACCDADGGYWSAQIDGWSVVRYTPNGHIDRVVSLPVQWPSMCAFGGADLGTLYITTIRRGGARQDWPDQPLAGSLFACRPGVRGLAEPAFGPAPKL